MALCFSNCAGTQDRQAIGPGRTLPRRGVIKDAGRTGARQDESYTTAETTGRPGIAKGRARDGNVLNHKELRRQAGLWRMVDRDDEITRQAGHRHGQLFAPGRGIPSTTGLWRMVDRDDQLLRQAGHRHGQLFAPGRGIPSTTGLWRIVDRDDPLRARPVIGTASSSLQAGLIGMTSSRARPVIPINHPPSTRFLAPPARTVNPVPGSPRQDGHTYKPSTINPVPGSPRQDGHTHKPSTINPSYMLDPSLL
jgi:hypothetical protein